MTGLINRLGKWLMNVPSLSWSGISARHLFALAVVRADVGEFPADVEQHVVLSRSPLLHEVRGEHPGPEHDAVIFKTAWRNKHTHTESESEPSWQSVDPPPPHHSDPLDHLMFVHVETKLHRKLYRLYLFLLKIVPVLNLVKWSITLTVSD